MITPRSREAGSFKAPKSVVLWIWLCAYLNLVGWTLSAMGQLNAPGYWISLTIGVVALLLWMRSREIRPNINVRKFFRRFKRPFPAAFLILAVMAFWGGVLYAPTNYDGLAYRVPRVLHWLAEDRWHWIHTVFPRVNTRGCGMEWVSAPIISLLKTDRPLFLINIVSFLLLPGLIFSVFTRLGVRRRVAWYWMWIVPTGYCFLLQAGSLGNDLYGAPFVLASVDFALRARFSRASRDLFASILAAALLTGAKLSNVPLLLPWALAILPSVFLVKRWLLKAASVAVLALCASCLPTMIFNAQHYQGDWSGWRSESKSKSAPVFKVAANSVLITVQNLTPPVFPYVKWWDKIVQRAMLPEWEQRLQETMAEPGARDFRVQELQVEESAGLGFGVVVLLVVSLGAAAVCRVPKVAPLPPNGEKLWLAAVRVAPLISLFALLSKSDVSPLSRILAPYYALLLPVFLLPAGHRWVIRQTWWRWAAYSGFAMAAGLLIVSPPRPLFPVKTLLLNREPSEASRPWDARARSVYSVYQERANAFAPALAALPAGLDVVGLFTYDDPETSLWRPFGSRRIVHVVPEDTAAELRRRGMQYIIISSEKFPTYFRRPFDEWLKDIDGELVQNIPLHLRASQGPSDWALVRLR